MKNLLSFLLIFLSGQSLYADPGLNSRIRCSWNQTFNEDFNEPQLDTSFWSTAYSSGGNGELQYYSPDALSLNNGKLLITATNTPANGYPYTSGIIHTQGKFSQEYGRFSIRAKLPKGKGYWPAFWLLPAKSNFPLEIDVFEYLGHKPHVVYLSQHWSDAAGHHLHRTHASKINANFSTGFHTFTLDWSPDELRWSIDGVTQFRSTSNIPNVPMFLLINLAVGGKWPGNPDSTTHFPASMQVDYVHVYQKVCTKT
jgi:beta-glucanase (GH16 family)